MPGEFDDYIANPKESMYQSLHTAVIGPEGQPLEMQIRTREMHRDRRVRRRGALALQGRARRATPRVEAKIAWLRHLMDWRDEIADAEEFVESLKSDVFQEQIYVFTPAGDIIELPAGATPVDFAYRIHTEVGHHCVGAKVNDQHVPLDYKLQNGQVVKIITSKTTSVRAATGCWPSSGTSPRRTPARRSGSGSAARSATRTSPRAGDPRPRAAAPRRRRRSWRRLPGISRQLPRSMISSPRSATARFRRSRSRLARSERRQERARHRRPTIECRARRPRLQVHGVGDLLTNLAQCCNPVCGDEIIGYVTRGRGITVHRADCPNIARLGEPERLVPVSWGTAARTTFPSPSGSRPGTVSACSRMSARCWRTNGSTSSPCRRRLTTTARSRCYVTVEIEGIGQLSRISHKLESIQDVFEVRRDASVAPVRAAAS